MLRLARKRHPDIVLHRGDMVSFKLKKRFDAIKCLFSAVGHVKTKRNWISLFETCPNISSQAES